MPRQQNTEFDRTLFKTSQSRSIRFAQDKTKGFTLIELLVVISIIALLSTIVLAVVQDGRIKAQNTAKNNLVLQYINAIELYATNHEGIYPDSDTVNPTYYNCLGFEDGEKCHPVYEGLESLNTDLAPFYTEMPRADDFFVQIGTSEVSGIMYQKDTGNGYKLLWYLKNSSTCIRGAQTTESTGKTQCLYPE